MARVSSSTPIVALDVASAPEAMTIVDELGASCRFYKVGSELFTGVGPAIVAALRDRGCDVFLDLKLHDIPTTVAGAVRTAAALGARLVTVHATGGEAMLSAAVSSAGDQTKCGVLAVTVLTSLASRDVAGAWGRPDALDLSTEVQRLAAMVANVGAHGVVCSGREARGVRDRYGDALRVLVPGVRPAGAATQDQARSVTAREAAEAGASYVVIGRAVTQAPDRAHAFEAMLRELG